MAEQGTPPPAGTGGFTQEQVNSMVANALHQERQKYADYEDLKAKVAAAEQEKLEQQTQLEQLTTKVTQLTDTLAQRDVDALRLKVAADAKLTPAQAEFLTGTTEADLKASALKVRETFGLKDEPAGEGEGDEGEQPQGGQQQQQAPQGGQQQHTRRPQELQAGGAPAQQAAVTEMDPGKLADMIGSR